MDEPADGYERHISDVANDKLHVIHNSAQDDADDPDLTDEQVPVPRGYPKEFRIPTVKDTHTAAINMIQSTSKITFDASNTHLKMNTNYFMIISIFIGILVLYLII